MYSGKISSLQLKLLPGIRDCYGGPEYIGEHVHNGLMDATLADPWQQVLCKRMQYTVYIGGGWLEWVENMLPEFAPAGAVLCCSVGKAWPGTSSRRRPHDQHGLALPVYPHETHFRRQLRECSVQGIMMES